MEASLKGTVVIINFPFSDLSASKKRPALVVADWGSIDVILAQITSVAYQDRYAIDLYDEDFKNGALKKTSFIRPNKLFTADKTTFLQIIGGLNDNKIKEVIDKIHAIIR